MADALATYPRIRLLPISVEQLGHPHDVRAIHELELARKYQLSIYDAAYLALAKASSHPLATLDIKLSEAARKEGILFNQ